MNPAHGRAILLYSSAVLYAIPLLFSTSCWWVAFLVLPLFLYAVHDMRMSAMQGFLWGLLALCAYGSSFIAGIFFLARGPYLVRAIPLVVGCAWIGAGAALWFWVTEAGIRWFSKYALSDTRTIRLMCWAMSTCMYLVWIDRGCLWLFGRWEGLCVANLLVPLVSCPALLYGVSRCGVAVGLCMLVATAAMSIAGYIHPTKTRFILLCACSMFWLIGFFIAPQDTENAYQNADNWVVQCKVIPRQFFALDAPFSTAHALWECVHACCMQYPAARIFIFPESAVSDPHACALFTQLYLKKAQPVHVLIGGFSEDTHGYRNSVYWWCKGKAPVIFHKNHASPVTERISFAAQIPMVRSAYFSTMPEINPAIDKTRMACQFDECNCAGVIYICSELFFNNDPHDHHLSEPIIALCNDAWANKIAAQQMYYCARFKAIAWQRDIVYAAYRYQAVLAKTGEVMGL